MMFLPDPEYPWKWNWRLEGQPSEYLGFNTVGRGTILHREHLKHFCISASSSFSRDIAIAPLYSGYLEDKTEAGFRGRMNPLIQRYPIVTLLLLGFQVIMRFAQCQMSEIIPFSLAICAVKI